MMAGSLSLFVVLLIIYSSLCIVHARTTASFYKAKSLDVGFAHNVAIESSWDVAVIRAQFDKDIYVKLDCSSGNCCGPQSPSIFAPCCDDCDPSTRVPLANSTKNKAGCICSSTATAVCLDGSAPILGGSFGLPKVNPDANQGDRSWVSYEVGIVNSCRNMMVQIEKLTGDPDLFISLRYFQGNADVAWYSQALYEGETIGFCCSANESSASGSPYAFPGPQNLNTILSARPNNATPARLYINAPSYGAYRLHIKEAPLDNPNFLVPLSHAPTMRVASLTCYDSTANQSASAIAVHGDFAGDAALFPLPPTTDPAFDSYSSTSGYIPTNASTVLGNTAAFLVYTGTSDYTYYSTAYHKPFVWPLSVSFGQNCTMDLSWALDSTGQPLAPDPVPLTLEMPSCNLTQMRRIQSLITNFQDVLLAENGDVTEYSSYKGAAITTSAAWIGCLEYVHSLTSVASALYNNSAPTTDCPYQVGSAQYNADPCCNAALKFSQCCVPRVISNLTTIVTTPNTAKIASRCRTPQCATSALASVVSLQDAEESGVDGCQAAAATYAGFNQLTQPLALCVYEDVNSPTTPDTIDKYVQCIVDTTEPSLRTEFLLYLGKPSTSTDSEFKQAILDRYLLGSGCLQSGCLYNIDDNQRYVYWLGDDDLHTNQANCEASDVCNWDAMRPGTACAPDPLGWRGDSFCGACDAYGNCQEVSTFRGCVRRGSWDLRPGEMACAETGGVWSSWDVLDFLEGEMWDDRYGVCYYPNITTQDECQPVDFCGPLVPASGDVPTECYRYCYWPELSTDPALCSCDGIPPDHPAVSICYAIAPDSLGNCTSPWYNGAVSTAQVCKAYGGQFWSGSLWYEDFLNDKASCESLGVCPQPLVVPVLAAQVLKFQTPTIIGQDDCDALSFCDGCRNCTVQQCSLVGGKCNDDVLQPAGACHYFATPSDSGFVDCSTSPAGLQTFGFISRAQGCFINDATAFYGTQEAYANDTLCAAAGGIFMTPATNKEQCEAAKACYETSGTFAGRFTPKDLAANCGCNSEPRSLFRWTPGNAAWVNGSVLWRQLSWRPRQYGHFNKWGSRLAFNITGFNHDFYRLLILIYQRRAETYNYCVAGQLSKLITSIVCDCSNATDRLDCFPPGQGELLGLKRLCSGVEQTFSLPSLQLVLTEQTSFSSGCIDMLVFSHTSSALLRHYDTVISSTFVASLEKDSASVVPNHRHVIVGKLRGDGVTLQFGSKAQNLTLCLALRDDLPPSSRFPTPDFAGWLNNSKDFSARSLRPLYLPVQRVGNFYCSAVSAAGSYFPIDRYAKAESKTYSDTLSKSQRGALIAAVVVYMILLVAVTYRVLHIVLYLALVGRQSRNNITLLQLVYGFLLAIVLLRVIYFWLVLYGKMVDAPKVVELLVAQLPTYFFFTIFTLLVFWWVELCYWAEELTGALNRLKWIFVAVNAFVYVFLLVMVIAYGAKSQRNLVSVNLCLTSFRKDTAPDRIAKAYHVFLASLCFLLVIGFAFYGFKLLSFLNKVQGSATSSVSRKFMLLATTSASALLVETALLIYTTFSSHVSTVLALVLLLVVEAVPTVAMVWNLRQPRMAPGLGDSYWFLSSRQGSSKVSDGVSEGLSTPSTASNASTSRF